MSQGPYGMPVSQRLAYCATVPASKLLLNEKNIICAKELIGPQLHCFDIEVFFK